MFRKVLLTFGLLLMAEMAALAQGTLKGTITDAKTGEELPFVNIIVKQDGKQVHGGSTDLDGVYSIKPLNVGTYDIEVSAQGYGRYVKTGVHVKASGFTIQDIKLNPTATNLQEVTVEVDVAPVIEIGSPEQGARITSEDIAHMPGNSVDAIVAAVGGMGYNDGGTSSARGEGNMVTMQGGVRKRTGINVPKDAIAEIQVILGGTPASIGEAIGGTQIITLKPPTSQFQGLVRWEGYLDYRLYNTLIVYLTGPVYKQKIKDENGNVTGDRTLVGFRFTGQAAYEKSPFYRVKGYRYQVVKDNLVRFFETKPLSYDPLTGGTNYTAETELRKESFHEITRLGSDDFTSASRVPDLQYYSIAMEGALDFRFSEYTSLVVTGEFSASHSPSASISPLNMPLSGSTVSESMNMVLTLDFTQRFKDPEVANEDDSKASSPIKNVMYNITGMVNRTTAKQYNENFGSSIDDVFKYGYIGKFITEKFPSYESRLVDYRGTQRWAQVQNNWYDQVTYVSGSGIYNPILANYNEQLFSHDYNMEHFGSDEFEGIRSNLITMDYIRAYKGLFNGDSPASIYGLISNVGVQGGSYAASQNDYLYLSAKASADILGHDIEIGFQYDQLWNSYYGLSAYGLWTLMRNNANVHISQMDVDNPIYEIRGSQLYVNYNRKLNESQQTFFDRAFRDYLISNGATNTDGSLIDQLTWIDIDRYMPDDFVRAGGLSMFSTDELFNSGNSYVSFYGFDHTGEKYSGSNWSLEKFFNPGDGKFRYLPAFSPIYAAGYIQDKFYFQDLIFNVGVRVDYFNGNQYVMKDPYLLYESFTVADLRNNPALIGGGGQYLYNAGADWVPYVNQTPTVGENGSISNAGSIRIVGYRDQSGKWYNADGVEVASPSAVNGNTGKPIPYYTSNGVNAINNRTVGTEAFERYTPQIVAMPRIAFSFPIGETSQFKASYDIIARRPSGGWEAEYTKYLFMSQISSINNPNLKPERITNYELGFQQALTDKSAISASAYYKETRDLIQLVQYAGADPNPNYYSYDNKDFRTIKGVTLAYDLRQSGNIRINANYTLQYAEGTGLSSTTMTELIKEGYTTLKMLNPIADDRRHEFKANVDFRYRSGSQYDGPVITRIVTDSNGEERKKDIKLLENFGINFMAVAQSGRPYTKAFSNSQNTIVGGYRGARLPWGFYFNVVIDKVWPVKVGKRDTYITAAVTINNLFDIRNVLDVFKVTGNPEDNGYLTDPESQQVINAYLDPQAFRDIYSIVLRNGTWNYSSPRTIRLSLSYNF
jgi:hypothetical protein